MPILQDNAEHFSQAAAVLVLDGSYTTHLGVLGQVCAFYLG